MNGLFRHIQVIIALLIVGSAILLSACGRSGRMEDDDDNEGLKTQQGDSLRIIESTNGRKKYRFTAPLMEAYEYAKEPYREFPEGIHVITYSDSTGTVESTLVADYAIEFINQKLWEAKGNVVATNAKGQMLETQQLFWNQRTHKVYSNIDSRVTQGTDVIVGVGFESDEEFKDWEIRRPRGKVTVDVEPNRDSTATTHRPQPQVDSSASSPATQSRPAQPASSSPGQSPRPDNTRRRLPTGSELKSEETKLERIKIEPSEFKPQE